MEIVKYRDFVRKPKDYMGKRVDIIGREGVIASLFPPVLSDNKEKFEELKKEIVGIQKEKVMDEESYDVEMLKLRGEQPLDLNEYIDEVNGDLRKFKCDFCGTDKTLIKMNSDGNNICLNCSPSIPAFASYKSLVEYSKKSEAVIPTSGKLHKQTKFSNKVNAIPKPVKKKSKSTL